MESQSLNRRVETWRAQVRREVKAVTTRSPLLRREMIIHPLAPRSATTRSLYVARSDVERTFPLKDVTGFIARANYDANCSNDERQTWIIVGRRLAAVIPPLTRSRLTKKRAAPRQQSRPDNYRSVTYPLRLTAV